MTIEGFINRLINTLDARMIRCGDIVTFTDGRSEVSGIIISRDHSDEHDILVWQADMPAGMWHPASCGWWAIRTVTGSQSPCYDA